MQKKYQKMKEIIIKEDVKDKIGMTISKGTRALIETELDNPMTKKKEYVLLIDNGTGMPELYPKSLIEVEKLEG